MLSQIKLVCTYVQSVQGAELLEILLLELRLNMQLTVESEHIRREIYLCCDLPLIEVKVQGGIREAEEPEHC